MCCFKIWYFFIPNIVCIKGEEYDELKGALGNKKRLKSWWITFNHTDDDDEMKADRKKGGKGVTLPVYFLINFTNGCHIWSAYDAIDMKI